MPWSFSCLPRGARVRAAARRLLVAGLLASLLPVVLPARGAGCEATGPLPGEAGLPVEQRALLEVARRLPLDVKVGQVLIPGFVGTQPDAGLLERARRGRIGGFFLLARNIRDADQVRDLTVQLSQAAAGASRGIAPFVATDFEGGRVNALRAVAGNRPAAAEVVAEGASGVQARGAADAALLRALGFNVNLAPVADVLSAPTEVIGDRAYASDPAVVAEMSRAYLRGLQGGGVLGVMKHFPGHGSTPDDSHVTLPTVPRSLAQLEAADFLPYRRAIAAGELQAMMVGHVLVPALDPEAPASLSQRIITGLARERLGFGGLIITDELKMAAISRHYGVADAAVRAVQAGVDVILADYTGAEQLLVVDAVRRACLDGRLAPGRLEQSVARILRAKLAYGLAGSEVAALYGAALTALASTPAPTPVPAPDLGGVRLIGEAEGRWYAEAAGGEDFGYAITDEGGIGLWQSYAALGGPPVLGYPISQRFVFGEHVVQLTQRALLRWHPEQRRAVPANAFELFERAGSYLGWPGCAVASFDRLSATQRSPCSLDGWLMSKGIPPPIADDGSNGDYRRAVATRLLWLEDAVLRDSFLADPRGGPAEPWPGFEALIGGLEGVSDDLIPHGAIQRYGLPMSQPQRYGPFLAQRFQRVALLLWLEQVSGMPPPGSVSFVLAGELLREAGFAPVEALRPTTLEGVPGPLPELPPPPVPPHPPTPAAAAATAVSPQMTPTPVATPIPAASPTASTAAALTASVTATAPVTPSPAASPTRAP